MKNALSILGSWVGTVSIVVFALIVLDGPARAATVVYDTFGPGDSFDTGASPSFQGPVGSPTDIRIGNQFTPSASGALTSVTLAAGLLDTSVIPTSANSLRLEIWTNEIRAGQQEPGTLLESANLDGQMGVIGKSIVTVPFSGNTSMVAGVPYWLVALPNPFKSSASGGWNLSEGSTGWTGQFLPQFIPFPAPGLWIGEWVTQEATQGAFRVEAVIPIPAAFWLFGSAVLGLIGLRWQRRVGLK